MEECFDHDYPEPLGILPGDELEGRRSDEWLTQIDACSKRGAALARGVAFFLFAPPRVIGIRFTKDFGG